ncbi:MAG: tetratricopeptide repeat protein [Pedosphaera sp.]|nr:tetratricopeptide repeat protein [Pedosphaera sp.]
MSLQIQPKHEEQQHEFDLSFSAMTWLEENKRLLTIAFVIVSLGVVGAIIKKNLRATSEAAAESALFDVLKLGVKDTVISAQSLNKVVAEHSGTKAAERALFLVATRQYEEGKFLDAQKTFETFVAAYSESSLNATADLGIATSLDAQNKTTEAISAYQSFITRFPKDSLIVDARLSKARIHESIKQFKEALALYDELGRGGFNGGTQEAARRRTLLIQANPDLGPKPAAMTNSIKIPSVGHSVP